MEYETKKTIIVFAFLFFLLCLGFYFEWLAFHTSILDNIGYVYGVIGPTLFASAILAMLLYGQKSLNKN